MKTKTIAAAMLMAATAMMSCTPTTTSNTGKSAQAGAPTAIFDTDLGSSADDVFALTMLYDAHRSGSVDLKAVMVNRPGIENLRTADILDTYYGFPGLAIGQVHDAPQNTQVFIPYWQMAMPETYPETPRFRRTLSDEQLTQLPYAETLYREILADSPDTSVVIFSVGFATNIGHLLSSKPDTISDLDGVTLVSKKVKALYIQGGHLSNYGDEPEYNLRLDPKNALTLINQWPRPIYFSPGETGERFEYTPEAVTSDQKANGLEDSPINYIYTHFDCNTGQKMWDACAVLQYLHPEYFDTHGPVRYTIDDDMILHELTSEKDIRSNAREGVDNTKGESIHNKSVAGRDIVSPYSLAINNAMNIPLVGNGSINEEIEKDAHSISALDLEDYTIRPSADYGESWYDKKAYSHDDYENLNEVRAREQGLPEKPGGLHYMTFTTTARQDSLVMDYIRKSASGGLPSRQ